MVVLPLTAHCQNKTGYLCDYEVMGVPKENHLVESVKFKHGLLALSSKLFRIINITGQLADRLASIKQKIRELKVSRLLLSSFVKKITIGHLNFARSDQSDQIKVEY